jgi:hypothetical protein
VDYWDLTKLLFRRWYIAVPLLLVTFAAAGYIGSVVKPDYQLTSYVQLIPAVTTPDPTSTAPQNPWNQLGLDALSEAADYATLDQTFLNSLKDGGYSTNIVITFGEPPAGATIEVVATSQDQAEKSTEMTIDRFRATVAELQTSYGVRAQDLITVTRLDRGENLKRPGGKVKRAIIAVAGAGILISGGVTIALDFAMRRRRRRAETPADLPAYEGRSEPDYPAWPPGPGRGSQGGNRRRGTVPAPVRAEATRQAAAEERAREAPATDDTALIPSIPSDTTMVLSRPRPWPPADNGRNRGERPGDRGR